MKILVVSLLRLGDVLLAAPAISSLRCKYPRARIDILVNDQARAAAQVIPAINVWHCFERQSLQQGLLDPEGPILDPFFRLEELVERLRAENYDMVLNFTHNRLSGWLCGAIEARQTIGLALDVEGRPRFGSPWFQFLNENADRIGQETFHLADIFSFGAGLEGCVSHWQWREPSSGDWAEAAALPQPFVALQPFSSEEKKEWGSAGWVAMARRLTSARPDLHLVVLGAPGERERVDQMINDGRQAGVQLVPAICSLSGAVAILSKASALLTVDTSIKHLAAPLPTRVIEISLGSSDWARTGVYKSGGLIIQPRIACAPCLHSAPCSKSAHECAGILRPELVADLIAAMLAGDDRSIDEAASEAGPHVDLIKTDFSAGGYWQGVPAGREPNVVDLRRWLDKLTAKMFLEGEHLQELGAYGTEAFRLGDWLKKRFPQAATSLLPNLIVEIERDTQAWRSQARDARQRLGNLLAESRAGETIHLGDMRRLHSRVTEIDRRLEIRGRLVRSLKAVVEDAI